MQHFILHRRGTFESIAPDGEREWCRGPKHKDFAYEVILVVPNRGQQIVVYNEDIAEAITPPKGTCEGMAAEIFKDIETLLTKRNLEWNLIHVKVSPVLADGTIPPSNMEFVAYRTDKDIHLLPLAMA